MITISSLHKFSCFQTLIHFPKNLSDRTTLLHRILTELHCTFSTLSDLDLLPGIAQWLRFSSKSVALHNPGGDKHVYLPELHKGLLLCPNWTTHFSSTVIKPPFIYWKPAMHRDLGLHYSLKLHRHAWLSLCCLLLNWYPKLRRHVLLALCCLSLHYLQKLRRHV